jgi:tetratricopeptide (TPR) repeat protein
VSISRSIVALPDVLTSARVRVLHRLLPIVVFAAVFVAFVPALDGQFLNWDDDINFLENPGFRGLGWAQVKWMWTQTLMGHYIPLTWMSLGVNYTLGGMDPWGYHLGNVLIHAMNAAVFYFVARRLLVAAGLADGAAPLWGAAFAAVVFGAHPLRAESVAWVTERRDVLCGLFFLLATLMFLISLGPNAGRGTRFASLAAFGAAILCKAQAVPLPLALLILDAYPLRRLHRGWRPLLIEKVPYFALALVGGVVAIIATRNGATFTSYAQYGPGARLAMTGYGIMFYPWKWLWPTSLCPLYELPTQIDPLSARFLPPLVAMASITVLLVALRRRWPAGLAAWAYSAVMLLPLVGPLHTGNQLAHDRYSYLSGLGFAALAGGGLACVLWAVGRGMLSPLVGRVALAGATLVVLGLGSATWVQASGWRDSETLWSWAVETHPECAICLNNLALAFMSQNQRPEAEAALRQSLAIREHAMTHNNLGGLLELRGRPDEAEQEYRRALRLKPDLPQPLANLGDLLVKHGRYADAITPLRRVFLTSPGLPRLRTNLARALRERGDELARTGNEADAAALRAEASRVQP